MNGRQTLRKLSSRLYGLYSRLGVARRLSLLVRRLDRRGRPPPSSLDRHAEVRLDSELLHHPRRPSWGRCEIHLDLDRGETLIEGAGPNFRSRIDDLAGPRGVLIHVDGVRE